MYIDSIAVSIPIYEYGDNNAVQSWKSCWQFLFCRMTCGGEEWWSRKTCLLLATGNQILSTGNKQTKFKDDFLQSFVFLSTLPATIFTDNPNIYSISKYEFHLKNCKYEFNFKIPPSCNVSYCHKNILSLYKLPSFFQNEL